METTLTRKHVPLGEVCFTWEGFLLFMGQANQFNTDNHREEIADEMEKVGQCRAGDSFVNVRGVGWMFVIRGKREYEQHRGR